MKPKRWSRQSDRRRFITILAALVVAVGGAVAASALAQDDENETADENLTNETADAEANATDAEEEEEADAEAEDAEEEEAEDEEVLAVVADGVELVNSTFDNDTNQLVVIMDLTLSVDETTQEALEEVEPGDELEVTPAATEVTVSDAVLVEQGVSDSGDEAVLRVQLTVDDVDPVTLLEPAEAEDAEADEEADAEAEEPVDDEENATVEDNETAEDNLTEEDNATEEDNETAA